MTAAEDLKVRMNASFGPYHQANATSVALTLAYIKALCAEAYPQAKYVRCDITDQGGDTLVFLGLEDGENDIEEADEDDIFRDRIEDALMNLTDADVLNSGTRRRPLPMIDLTLDYPVPPQPPVLYEKCAGCHLFVADNPAYEPGLKFAELIHLHRGDDADEALDGTHEPQRSGMLATLDVWKAFGPPLMRIRFTDGPQRGVRIGYHGEEHLYPLADDDRRSEHEIARHAFTHIGVDVIVDGIPHTAQEG